MKITISDILDTTNGKLVGSFQDSTVMITALVCDSRYSCSILFSSHSKGTKIMAMILLTMRLIEVVLGVS